MISKTKRQRSQLILRFFGGVLSGALATLSFAPYSYWFVIFFSLLALILLIDKQSPRQALFIGLGWGLGQFTTGVRWVYVVIDKFGGLPLPIGLALIGLLVTYLAFYPAMFAYLSRKVLSRKVSLPYRVYYWLFIPALWLAVDWLRGYLFTGFPWLWPGYSQIDTPFASIAPVLGVQGVTLFMLIFISSIALSFKERRFFALTPAVLILIACFLGNHISWVTKTQREAKVAIVQGNVPQELKWLPQYRWPTLLKYQDLTRKNSNADIIIWPEAAIPATENELPNFLSKLDSEAKNSNTALITGILNKTQTGLFYNNVIALGNNGAGDYQYPAKESYSKHHLLIFGEYVPFEKYLRPLAPFFNLPMSSFSSGDFTQANLNAKGYRLATALCYEIAFHEQVRRNLTPNSDFILTLSNDTWFGDSIGPFQHLEIARMRALENGKPVLRATNTGLTAVIDHKGNFIEQIPQFETAVLRTSVATTQGQTPYLLFGELPLRIWVGLCFLVSLVSFYLNRKKSKDLHRGLISF